MSGELVGEKPGASSAARRRLPRGVKPLIWIVVVLVLLVGAAELALRLIVPGIIAASLRDQLDLSADHEVDVSLGTFEVLSAVQGGLGDVTVTVPDVPVMKDVNVDGEAHVDFVPFDLRSKPLSGGTARLTVAEGKLSGLLKVLTDGLINTGEVAKDQVTVGKTLEVFGQDVPVTATIGLDVKDGDVVVVPKGATAAGFDFSAKKLQQATGSLLDPILKKQTVCIKDRIPKGITLTGIDLSSTGAATLEGKLDDGILSDASQLETGTCG